MGRFSNFVILENFCNRFLRNYQSEKESRMNMDNDWMYCVYSGIGAKGPKLMELCPFECFQILPFLKISVTDFSEPKKARKLKFPLNMDNG